MTTRDLSPEYQAPFYPAVQYLESALEPEITAIEHWTEHRAEFEDKEIALLEFTDAVTTLEGREAAVPDELWARMDPAKVEGASEFDLAQ